MCQSDGKANGVSYCVHVLEINLALPQLNTLSDFININHKHVANRGLFWGLVLPLMIVCSSLTGNGVRARERESVCVSNALLMCAYMSVCLFFMKGTCSGSANLKCP